MDQSPGLGKYIAIGVSIMWVLFFLLNENGIIAINIY